MRCRVLDVGVGLVSACTYTCTSTHAYAKVHAYTYTYAYVEVYVCEYVFQSKHRSSCPCSWKQIEASMSEQHLRLVQRALEIDIAKAVSAAARGLCSVTVMISIMRILSTIQTVHVKKKRGFAQASCGSGLLCGFAGRWRQR